MYKVSEELLQAIFRYLATRPYAEVIQLVNEIQKLAPEPKVEGPKE